jgi:hypothetical protein
LAGGQGNNRDQVVGNPAGVSIAQQEGEMRPDKDKEYGIKARIRKGDEGLEPPTKVYEAEGEEPLPEGAEGVQG